MTMILATGNSQYAIQVSDRRLCSGREYVEDEANKAIVALFRDGRMTGSFTGLARCDGFDTRKWFLETLLSVIKGKQSSVRHSFDEFTTRATNQWERLRVSAAHKRTTFVFAGYVYSPPDPGLYVLRVSNFEQWRQPSASSARDRFIFERCCWNGPDNEEPHGVFWFGDDSAESKLADHVSRLDELVAGRKPVDAIVHKACDLIRHAADHPRSRGRIGKQCNSIILPADPSQPARAGYETDEFKMLVEIPGFVDADVAVDRLSFGPVSPDAAPVAWPKHKVRKKGPCPCGSGKRTQDCHPIWR